MSVESTAPAARMARRATTLQTLTLATGYLVVVAWAIVGAWPMTVVLGLPLLIAACLVPRRPRAAAMLASVPAAVVSVWWIVEVSVRGPSVFFSLTEFWFLVAGPVAAMTCVVAARVVAADAGRKSFSAA